MTMTNDQFLTMKWYAKENDLIGGWCIMSTDDPPSTQKGFPIGDFLTEELTNYIVELHNAELEKKQVRKQFNDAIMNFGNALIELSNHLPKKKINNDNK